MINVNCITLPQKSHMRISSLVILAGFTIMGIFLMYYGMNLGRKGIKAFGRPSIKGAWFYAGKLTIFTSWGFLIFAAIMVLSENPPGQILYPLPAAILSSVGAVMMSFSFRDLGDSLRVGLPGEATSLKTGGIYRFSRNPIYVGVDLIAVASILFIPLVFNIICAVIGIVVHHFIILSEEKFLENRFKEEWPAYKKKTRRYF